MFLVVTKQGTKSFFISNFCLPLSPPVSTLTYSFLPTSRRTLSFARPHVEEAQSCRKSRGWCVRAPGISVAFHNSMVICWMNLCFWSSWRRDFTLLMINWEHVWPLKKVQCSHICVSSLDCIFQSVGERWQNDPWTVFNPSQLHSSVGMADKIQTLRLLFPPHCPQGRQENHSGNAHFFLFASCWPRSFS